MNVVLIISVLAGLSAAGFVWFGWDLFEAIIGRMRTAAPESASEEAADKE